MEQIITSPETVGFSSMRLERIKPTMQSFVDQRGYAGISTLLARRGQVFHFEQVGYQDRESQMPLSPDAIYRIYSMTKPIVCTAFMTLLEEGRLLLSDFLAKYIPTFAQMQVLNADGKAVGAVRPITVHDLLTHTSGLTYDFLEDSPVSELYRQVGLTGHAEWSLEAIIAALADLPLAYQPGSRWHYSVSIDAIARLIEVVSGQSLQSFLQERLFTPLGMNDTGFSVPLEKRARIASMYGNPDVATHSILQIFDAWSKGQSGRQDVEATYPSDNTTTFARGGHGLFSTALDYLRFAQMLLGRGELDGVRILAPKTVDFMHMNHLKPTLLPYEIGGIPSGGYGFGLGSRVLLNVAESGMPGSVGEFGWAGAANTYYWVDPQEELIGIFLTQYMIGFDSPEKTFQNLSYQALIS